MFIRMHLCDNYPWGHYVCLLILYLITAISKLKQWEDSLCLFIFGVKSGFYYHCHCKRPTFTVKIQKAIASQWLRKSTFTVKFAILRNQLCHLRLKQKISPWYPLLILHGKSSQCSCRGMAANHRGHSYGEKETAFNIFDFFVDLMLLLATVWL